MYRWGWACTGGTGVKEDIRIYGICTVKFKLDASLQRVACAGTCAPCDTEKLVCGRISCNPKDGNRHDRTWVAVGINRGGQKRDWRIGRWKSPDLDYSIQMSQWELGVGARKTVHSPRSEAKSTKDAMAFII